MDVDLGDVPTLFQGLAIFVLLGRDSKYKRVMQLLTVTVKIILFVYFTHEGIKLKGTKYEGFVSSKLQFSFILLILCSGRTS